MCRQDKNNKKSLLKMCSSDSDFFNAKFLTDVNIIVKLKFKKHKIYFKKNKIKGMQR